MKIMLIILSLLLVFSCKDEKSIVVLEDHKDQIDLNTALSQANEERLDLLEERIDVLEEEVDAIELELFVFNVKLHRINRKIRANNKKINNLKRLMKKTVKNIRKEINKIEQEFNVEINNINNNMTVINNNLQDQIDELENDITRVVYPCGRGNSQEVLLDTVDGLVAYFQSGYNKTISFEINETIPAHKECLEYKTKIGWFNISTYCSKYKRHNEIVISEKTTSKFFVLDKAFLDVLNDGYYRTTDGYNCTFRILNGALVGGQI